MILNLRMRNTPNEGGSQSRAKKRPASSFLCRSCLASIDANVWEDAQRPRPRNKSPSWDGGKIYEAVISKSYYFASIDAEWRVERMCLLIINKHSLRSATVIAWIVVSSFLLVLGVSKGPDRGKYCILWGVCCSRGRLNFFPVSIHFPMHDGDQEGAETGQHCSEGQCHLQAHLREFMNSARACIAAYYQCLKSLWDFLHPCQNY